MSGRRTEPESNRINVLLVEALKNHLVIPIPSDPLWGQLVKEHKLKVSAKALYTRAKRLVTKEVTFSSESSPHSEATVSSYKTSEDDFSEDDQYFKLTLSSEDIKLLEPEERLYGQRVYSKLKSGWTYIVAEKIYTATKLPCMFTFKQHFLSRSLSSTYYIRIKGVCNECKSVIICYAKQDSIRTFDGGVELSCIFKKHNKIHHTKKRQIRGSKRKELADELIEKKIASSRLRKKLAGETDILFATESPCIPKSGTLRQIKYEEVSQKRVAKDPVSALVILAQMNPFNRAIHEIAELKFFVHYWTPEQVRVYNALWQKLKYVKVSGDATGSVVQKLKRIEGSSGNIFFYCLVVSIPGEKEGQIPVGQMLSERHNANAIGYWLSEWVRLGAKPPHEFVCDYSPAFINAACRAFTGSMNRSQYIGYCFEFLRYRRNLPKCFIRIDVSHFIKAIVNWRELHEVHKKTKQFYIRVIGQLLLATDLVEAKALLGSIIIVASSETEGFVEGRPSQCETEKKTPKNYFVRNAAQPSRELYRCRDTAVGKQYYGRRFGPHS